jgi:hypothetical protein
LSAWWYWLLFAAAVAVAMVGAAAAGGWSYERKMRREADQWRRWMGGRR